MIKSKPTKYEFKNSSTLYAIFIALSIIIPSVLLYFLGLNGNPKLVIAVIILGLLNLVYFCRSYFDKEIKLVFDSEGIKTKKKVIKWEKVKNAEIRVTRSPGLSPNYDLIIHHKKGKETWIDVTNLDLTEEDLKMIVSQFLK
ncbi:hypothetical protein [Pedobacter xixiisoli]|uniref:PH domain-containing protein n=1 Tax=Pedobacter xixiisoli TaxID=1476464 RepID=A0A285ZYR3_9SPHI|nr:hypothetical protein [Pedobacter xixiisoli]SOD14747.1 hypothetical protein SAMN06297358_1733 [Pedobacter xixiisoli]